MKISDARNGLTYPVSIHMYVHTYRTQVLISPLYLRSIVHTYSTDCTTCERLASALVPQHNNITLQKTSLEN
jgi:hypothetical protein